MKVGGLLGGGEGNGSGTAPTGFSGVDEEETPNVAPEEQQQYDIFVKNGMELLYREDGTVQPDVLKRLSTGKKYIDTLAQTLVWLVMMLETSAKSNNAPISDDVLMHGGRELLEQLIDIADAAGIHKFTQAEQQGAWYQALDMYREANSGEGDRIDNEAAKASFEQLNEADKEGRGDEVVPGFYQQSERAIALAKEDHAPVEEEDLEDGDRKVLSARSRGGTRG